MFLIGDYRPRLGAVLLASNLLVALLFLSAALVYVNYFETDLVQEVETDLMRGGALMATFYRIGLSDDQRCRENWRLEDYPKATRHQGKPLLDQYYGTRQAGLKPFKSAPNPPLIFTEHTDVLEREKTADPCALRVGRAIQPYLADMERALSVSEPTDLFLVDIAGIVVAATLDDMYLSINIDEHAILQQVFQGEPLAALHESRRLPPGIFMEWGRRLHVTHGKAIEVVVGFPIILNNRVMGAVIARATPGSILDGYFNNMGFLQFFIVFILAWIIFSWWLMHFSIDRPIRAVMNQLRDAKDGSAGLDRAKIRSVTRDVKDIYQEVTSLLKERDRREEDTKNLAELLAHEVSGSVTAAGGAINLLDDHSDVMSPEETDRFLVLVKQKLKQLESLSKQLTTLARYEAPISEDDHVGIDDLLDQWRTESMLDRSDFIIQPQARGLYVAMRKEWLGTILSSLVENAHQHGDMDTKVIVIVDLDPQKQNFIRIKVHDDGPGIPTANAQKIFDPFFTTSRDTGSHGFGLAGVKKLVERHGGSIDLVSSKSGATFQIMLPCYMFSA